MAADNKFQWLILCVKCGIWSCFSSGSREKVSFCKQLCILFSVLQDVSNFLWTLIAHILWGSCNLDYTDLRYRLNGVVFITQGKYTYGVLNLNFQRPSIISHHTHLPHRGGCYNLTVLNLPNQAQSLCQYDATAWLKNCCDAAGDNSKTGPY